MRKVAIAQSNYIPWKGYFDLIASVDEFVLYDDMQYTRRDWRNRNQIKTPQGLQWLTIPVMVKGKYHQKINETLIEGDVWAAMHWRTLEHNYKRAAHFSSVAEWLEPLYSRDHSSNLSDLNTNFLEAICKYLGIITKITRSSDYVLKDGKTERLVDLCQQVGGTEYISGPAARNYIEESLFQQAGIKLTWFNYEGYREYSQLWGQFAHGVTILDLLFNCGPDAPSFLRYVKR